MKFHYDYVIVGAGSAGCVLAARLTEDPTVSVALVEAGGPDTAPEISLPIAFSQLFKTQYDWDFASEPEPALGGRRAYLPRGKMLGGSSSMNAMVYIRGNPMDFDGWEKQGAAGWSYGHLLPYFIKAEENERGDDRFHGRRGPLSVRDGRSMHPLADRFVQAAVEAGFPRNEDFNAGSQIGFGRFQVTQRDGARCSSARAYLHPARTRSNLHVFTDALVTRLQFDGARVSGVSLIREAKAETLHADRETILCAGAYGSPQLLMLSGIGPADAIKPLGIKPVADLPVGENLQDHPSVMLNYLTDQPTLLTAATAENFSLYQSRQCGPISSNVAEAGGFVASRPGLDAPDIELTMAPVMFVDEGLTAPYDHGISFGPCVLKPTSRGSVALRSARPDAKPRIRGNLLTTPEDKATMIAGVRICLDIAQQPSLAGVLRAVQHAPKSGSEADIWSYVQQRASILYHPTSTCSIGKVVDRELRVLGIEGLRVVDASVMPSVVSGNTNAAVIAIAEKAADLISGRRPLAASLAP
jgi:choline dehydrogenase